VTIRMRATRRYGKGVLPSVVLLVLTSVIQIEISNAEEARTPMNLDGLLFRKPYMKSGEVHEAEILVERVIQLADEFAQNEEFMRLVVEYVKFYRLAPGDDASEKAIALRTVIGNKIWDRLRMGPATEILFRHELTEVILRRAVHQGEDDN
jgi:hypothetical protein